MKTVLYPRLAWDGLRKNGRLSRPYLLTCICMVAVSYILSYLASPQALELIRSGRDVVGIIMTLGRCVILLFSLIFLYYTYSFLLRRRTREFGLYNVLGMGKRNLVRIISWESLIIFAVALAGGLFLGILLSKLSELELVNLLGGDIDYRFRLDTGAIGQTCLFYAVVFALIWFSAVVRISRSSTVSLLKAENTGEKPPKGNRFLALLGIVILCAAYWMAVTIDNPVSAMVWFFAAVLMVILATYLLMITGSIRMCRILQTRKKYYYRANHFVSVSSMAYRMKRNGAGLASICIIATMILVMLSTTTCMWFGVDDALNVSYPREISVTMYLQDPAQLNAPGAAGIRAGIGKYIDTLGVEMSSIEDFPMISLVGSREDSTVRCEYEYGTMASRLSALWQIDLVPADSFGMKDGSSLFLTDGEAVLLLNNKAEYSADTITLAMGEVSRTWHVKSIHKSDASGASSAYGAVPQITMIVTDPVAAIDGFDHFDAEGNRRIQVCWRYAFDTGLSDAENISIDRELENTICSLTGDAFGDAGIRSFYVDSRASAAADFYGTYSSLFFIGILLSVVFLLSAVLIIYYKQISEGYEDAKRFEIMQKVGMTKKEIRSSISSQLLTVFALPLAFAGMHLVFAFPMIRKMLTLFSLNNVALFTRTTVISFVAFALFYAIVYRLTSGVYYRIVSSAGNRSV